MSDVKQDLSEAKDPVAMNSIAAQRNKRRRKKHAPMNLSCMFCDEGIKTIMYKNIYHLQKVTSVRGKIIGAEKSGLCRKHQRMVTKAIKRARYMALLPYVVKDE